MVVDFPEGESTLRVTPGPAVTFTALEITQVGQCRKQNPNPFDILQWVGQDITVTDVSGCVVSAEIPPPPEVDLNIRLSFDHALDTKGVDTALLNHGTTITWNT